MKRKIIFLVFLFCSCTNNRLSGHVYDYDTEKPIEGVDVSVNGIMTQTDSSGYFTAKVESNATVVILLQKEDYAIKKVYRKPDSLGKFSKENLKAYKIYLFKKESDFIK